MDVWTFAEYHESAEELAEIEPLGQDLLYVLLAIDRETLRTTHDLVDDPLWHFYYAH